MELAAVRIDLDQWDIPARNYHSLVERCEIS